MIFKQASVLAILAVSSGAFIPAHAINDAGNKAGGGGASIGGGGMGRGVVGGGGTGARGGEGGNGAGNSNRPASTGPMSGARPPVNNEPFVKQTVTPNKPGDVGRSISSPTSLAPSPTTYVKGIGIVGPPVPTTPAPKLGSPASLTPPLLPGKP